MHHDNHRPVCKLYSVWKEIPIKAQVWVYGTLSVIRLGVVFGYQVVVEEALLASEEEEEENIGCYEEKDLEHIQVDVR